MRGATRRDDAIPEAVGISIHAPHAGCDRLDRNRAQAQSDFNPRTPCGVRPSSAASRCPTLYFNPRTPCGVRLLESALRITFSLFQSTHPMRGATVSPSLAVVIMEFQSTHPMRGATPRDLIALRSSLISIHAPHAGCDLSSRLSAVPLPVFQSTHPMRGATCSELFESYTSVFQSTHPMRGATRASSMDTIMSSFQSTHPMRGATVKVHELPDVGQISIHAPHAGCDFVRDFVTTYNIYFNPRTPCGVRPTEWDIQNVVSIFQSTHPMRGATKPIHHR